MGESDWNESNGLITLSPVGSASEEEEESCDRHASNKTRITTEERQALIIVIQLKGMSGVY